MMTTAEKPKLLRRKAASEYLHEIHGISRTPRTLAKLACIGGGPAMTYDGRLPLYPTTGLDAWATAKLSPTVTSTSERRVQRESLQQVAA